MGEVLHRFSVRCEVVIELNAFDLDGLEKGDILLLEGGKIKDSPSCALFLDDQRFGRGEVVDVEGEKGVRITRVSRRKGA